MSRIIDALLNNRWLVFGLLLMIIVGGIATMLQLPMEAFPDLTNNQVVVTVECPGMSPVEVEQLVTYPMETVMMGMPKLQTVRSTSKLELSMVTVIFDDSMGRYLIRQLVAERLNQVSGRIPANLQPRMNPMATAFGEVYQYTLSAPKMSLIDQKTLQDWNIRYSLLTIPGISEVNSWGGYTKQYTAEVDPGSQLICLVGNLMLRHDTQWLPNHRVRYRNSNFRQSDAALSSAYRLPPLISRLLSIGGEWFLM